MALTFRPRNQEELNTCMDAALAYLAKPEADVDPRIAGYVRDLTLESATTLQRTTNAHRVAQGAATAARDALEAADDAADAAIRQLFGHAKLNHPAAYAQLLSASQGRPQSDFTRLNGDTQVQAIRDLASRLQGLGQVPGLPAERVAEMVATNEALGVATRAASDAEGAQLANSEAMQAARVAFKADYRSLLDQLAVHYSEDQVAALLPRFQR